MSQATAHTVTVGQIVANNGEAFPDDTYHETSRATGNQQWVADRWADGALPTHSTKGIMVKLYTGTRNFEGFQYPDGKGKLMHYNHIQAIRTYSGLIIGDSSCYGRGWAHCSYPTDNDGYIDLTSLKTTLKSEEESIYDITEVNNGEVTFDSGRSYDLDDGEWIQDDPIGGNALGL